MKANELMIGDWVLDGTQISQITSITCGGVIETTAHEFSNIEVIAPIPLTAKILEKNGFKFDGEIYKLGDYQLVIEYRGGLFFGWALCCRKQLNYIHELQHAMKLCGIEKDIEL
jgi:hypothetical protein